MKLRYMVGRLIPDLIREEPINVGVILQSDRWVMGKFIGKIPKDWALPEDLVEDVAVKLDASWKERLSAPSEVIYWPDSHEQKNVEHTDKHFLDWLCRSHTKHLRFSETREADVEIGDAFDFETFLNRLYAIFVSPKPRLRQPVVRGRLHTKVRKEFIQLKLPPEKPIRERDVVIGSFPWPIDFIYEANGDRRREVGIGIVDFGSTHYVAKAKDLMATWVDVKNTRLDEVTRVTVVGEFAGLQEQHKALEMVKRSSDTTYVFEHDKSQFLDQVVSDLQVLPIFTSQDMQQTLRRVSRRLQSPSDSEPEKPGT